MNDAYNTDKNPNRLSHRDYCFFWGLAAIVGAGVGIIPMFGWLNWLVLPFALIGVVFCIANWSKGKEEGHHPHQRVKIGLLLCVLAVIIAPIRLLLGGGIM